MIEKSARQSIRYEGDDNTMYRLLERSKSANASSASIPRLAAKSICTIKFK